MTLNEQNKEAFDFYSASYKALCEKMQVYMGHFGATKIGYFRLYQGGKYLFMTNDFSLTKNIFFTAQEDSPVLAKAINSVKKEEFLFSQFLGEGEDFVTRLYKEYWGGISNIYKRYDDYVDVVFFSNHLNPHTHASYCANHIPLMKNLYWLVRETFLQHIPIDQPKVFAHVPMGADIQYHAGTEFPPINSSNIFSIQNLSKILARYHPYLTHREWEVCRGLMRGETARETSENLNMKKRTVENHLLNIHKKLTDKWGYRPSRAQVLEKLYDTMDKDLLTQILWGNSGIKSK